MVNVFSFCIYGPENPKYYFGLLQNIQLVQQHFPGWKVFVYAGDDVPESYVSILSSYPFVVVRHTKEHGHINSIHRFFAIDEPDVEIMMVRDADSRIHWKDRWAIRDFLRTSYGVHVIRDHVEHTTNILAGLWGIRKRILKQPIRELYTQWTPEFAGSGDTANPLGFGIDQNFLKMVIYSKVKSEIFVHYSKNRLMIGEVGVEFPFEWSNDTYCGRVELEYIDAFFVEHPHPRKIGLRLPNISSRFELPQSSSQPQTVSAPVHHPSVTVPQPSTTPLFINFLNRK